MQTHQDKEPVSTSENPVQKLSGPGRGVALMPPKRIFSIEHNPAFFPHFRKAENSFSGAPVIQAKLAIGQPGDIYEQEADAMAEKVVRKLEVSPPPPPIQRKCNHCDQEEQIKKRPGAGFLQAKSFASPLQVSQKAESNLNNSKSQGNPLPNTVRSEMEFGFGQSFENVSVHTDKQAIGLSREIGARAFTYGSDIYFNQSEFNPKTKEGKKLLAHELTHVIQQKPANKIFRTENQTQSHTYDPPEEVEINALRVGVTIKVPNVSELNVFQVVDRNYGGRWARLAFTFATGEQVTLDLRGFMQFGVRVGNGSWSPVLNFTDRLVSAVLRVFPTGELEFEGVPMSVLDVHSLTTGPRIYRFRLVGNTWQRQETDFTSRPERRSRITEGFNVLRTGNTAGFDLIERSFAERIRHDRLNQEALNDPVGDIRQNHLAEEFGQVLGRAVVHLFANNQQSAAAIQTFFLSRLYADTSPFTTISARYIVLNGYTNILLSSGNVGLVLHLLPALNQQLSQANQNPYLDHEGHVRLRTMAENELAAGRRANALALFNFGAATQTGGETRLLPGQQVGNEYRVPTAGGNLPLDLVMDGVTREFDGLPTSDNRIAGMRASQITFSTQWQARAQALNIFTPEELNQVPPAPEIMQRYFTAQFNGSMPGQFAAMRTELQQYMRIAFLHTEIDVPDALQIWNSQQLPTSADSRWAGDCGVMTRAVVHLLQGISGIQFRPISSHGHIRLLVLTDNEQDGLIESNQAIRPLESGSTLNQRVRRTISRNNDLQVLRNMPAPFSIGSSFTSAASPDIDQALDTSLEGAKAALPAVTPGLYNAGTQVAPIIHRYDDFRVRLLQFVDDSDNGRSEASSSTQQALQSRRETLLAEQQQIIQDLDGVSTTSRSMRRFISGLRTKIHTTGEYLRGRVQVFLPTTI